MQASRRGFLTGLVSLVAAPAIVRADSLMKLHHIPERWATVWGVGHDYEVIEHVLWEPTSAAQFSGAACNGGHIEKFLEITDWVYTKPMGSLDRPLPRVNPTQAYFEEERRKLRERGEDGPSMWSGYDLAKAEKKAVARKESREWAAKHQSVKYNPKIFTTPTHDRWFGVRSV
jgi:hypothetical protein